MVIFNRYFSCNSTAAGWQPAQFSQHCDQQEQWQQLSKEEMKMGMGGHDF